MQIARAALLGLLGSSVAPGQTPLGSTYCHSAPSSTGAVAVLSATGHPDVAVNDVVLRCEALPLGSFGMLLLARARDLEPGHAGGAGTLCLGGAIGRDVTQVMSAGPTGAVTLTFDTQAVAHPTQPFALVRGDTLNFQYWYRDAAPAGGATSNLSDAVSITFCPDPLFLRPVWRTSSTFQGAAIADVDGDGLLDVVTCSLGDDEVSIVRRRADGSYDSPRRVPAPGAFRIPVVADLTGDGRSDILYLANETIDRVYLLTQLPGGSFSAPQLVSMLEEPWAVTTGDLDGDGDLDLIPASVVGSRLTPLANDGNGAFTPMASITLPLPGIVALLADLDGDGDADIVARARNLALNTSFFVLRHAVNGTFGPAERYPAPPFNSGLTLGDLDGDAALDLVAASSSGSGTIAVRLNRGDGTFGAEARYSLGSVPGELFAEDLDADGDVDIGVGDNASYDFVRMWNDGTGRLAYGGSVEIERQFDHAQLLDCDGDGFRDVLAFGRGWFEPRLRIAPTTYESVPVLPELPDRGNPLDVVDIDADGFQDLVSVDAGRVTFTRIDGNFTAPTVTEYGLSTWLTSLAVADLDGDGLSDLVETGIVSGTQDKWLIVHQNLGGGAFAGSPLFTLPVAGRVSAIDIEGDGDVDVVVQLGQVDAPPLLLFENDGTGMLLPGVLHPFVPSYFGFDFVDVDGDGVHEFVWLDSAAGTLLVHHNTGGVSFGPGIAHPIGAGLDTLLTGDLDGDGDIDCVARQYLSLAAAIVWNDGFGGFGATTTLELFSNGTLDLRDVEGDGDLDLVLGSSSDYGGVTVHSNRGDGSFEPGSSFYADANETLFRDLDGDGDVDCVHRFTTSQTHSVSLNRCR